MPPRFIANQLSRPTGIGGRIIRALMNHGNAALNGYAVQQLELSPEESVMEIGFGGGLALKHLIDRAAFVCGVDRSLDAVKAARARYYKAVRAGAADFCQGVVECLPVSNAVFHKVLSVHTVYFWDLEDGAREIARTMKHNGRVVLGFVPKARMDRMNMPADIFTSREPQDVVDTLSSCGFKDVEERRPSPDSAWRVVTGLRRGTGFKPVLVGAGL
jgi:SAM-dependent methyltransferase